MYRVVHGSTDGLADVEAFLGAIESLDQHPMSEVHGLFDPRLPLTVARAPGRLDVMGGIADYSGSLVLQLPIREATLAAVQRQAARQLRIISLGAEAERRSPVFEMSMEAFEENGRPASYERVRRYFQRDSGTQWAAYAAGAFLVLMRERGVRFADGSRILITSDVPEGRGVSSSAAIEVAVMQAVAAAHEYKLDPREMAILCQKVENLLVGAPCGVMDQMTAASGRAGQLLALLCQPAELREPVEIPKAAEVWGIDSGVRHSVSGSDYTSVRVGAFMGYRMIADLAGLEVEAAGEPGGPVMVKDPYWKGYLANVTPSLFEQRFAEQLPERITGAEFLSHYHGMTDLVTHVDPEREYAVRMPTAHPIYEHFRVQAFAELLRGEMTEDRMTLLGELMYQSHASYSACGLGCAGTDLLIELVREAGPARGLFGAKITGGGSGGTVAVLGRRGAGETIQAIVQQYESRTGHQSHIFSGSSPGAAAFGHVNLVRQQG